MTLIRHCVTMISPTKAMIAGGMTEFDDNDGYNNQTLFYDFLEDEWSNGPDLDIDSGNDAISTICHAIKDVSEGTSVVVVVCKPNM